MSFTPQIKIYRAKAATVPKIIRPRLATALPALLPTTCPTQLAPVQPAGGETTAPVPFGDELEVDVAESEGAGEGGMEGEGD